MPEPVKVNLPEDDPSYFGVKEDCKGASCTVSGGRRRRRSRRGRKSRKSRRRGSRRSRKSRRR